MKPKKINSSFANILNNASVVTFKEDNVKDTFGDISWASGIFGDMSESTLANISSA